ncbi:MAG: PrsW family intramembrane metalloprotease [Lachnospiraceae bacterium]|nr:PrsW family intramembrane metalloprotease [Lachnospiraceae bacterium]
MPVLTLLAVIPSVFLLIKVYQADKVEKEPAPLLFKLFIKGLESAFFAAVVEALLINFGLNTLVQLGLIEGEGSFLYHAIEAFLIVAVAEEGFKYYFLKQTTWTHPAFDYRFDAVVYAVFVSLGFATIENILYVWGSQIESGTGLQLSVYRGVLSVPAHCVFAVAMGIHYGAAKYAQGHEQFDLEEAGLRKAFLVPVLMHGFFDFALMMNQPLYTGLFFVFVILADYRALKAVGRASQTDTRVYKSPSLTPPVQAVSYVQTTAPSQRPHVPTNPVQVNSAPANPAPANSAPANPAQTNSAPANPVQADHTPTNPAQADRVPSNPAQPDYTPTNPVQVNSAQMLRAQADDAQTWNERTGGIPVAAALPFAAALPSAASTPVPAGTPKAAGVPGAANPPSVSSLQ